MAISNKEEIKIYYELNNEKPKQVAAHFNISYRTLMHWIKTEKWEKAKHTKEIKTQIIADDLLQKEHFTLQNAASHKIKSEILDRLGVNASKIDESCLNAMLSDISDKILLEAMSINFIQKNVVQACLLAKNELLRLISNQKDDKPDALIIAAAEKMANMFANLQTLIYGKEPPQQTQINSKTDFSKLSNAQLDEILKSANGN